MVVHQLVAGVLRCIAQQCSRVFTSRPPAVLKSVHVTSSRCVHLTSGSVHVHAEEMVVGVKWWNIRIVSEEGVKNCLLGVVGR